MNWILASFKGLKGIENLPYKTRKKVDAHIRMKAVNLAEEKIMLSDKLKENYTEDQIQKLISKCEDEILQNYKNESFKVVLAALGIGYFL